MGNSNGEFEAKKYFTDHWKANTIHLFVAVKGKCFWSILFPDQVAATGNYPETIQ